MEKNFVGLKILVFLFVLALTWSCATSSSGSYERIKDFREVSGKWEGSLYHQGRVSRGYGSWTSVMTILEDGSGDVIINGHHFPMKRELVEGRIRVINQVSGAKGISWLVIKEGNQVLMYRGDDGQITGHYTRTKQ